jgi:hypothetical protein
MPPPTHLCTEQYLQWYCPEMNKLTSAHCCLTGTSKLTGLLESTKLNTLECSWYLQLVRASEANKSHGFGNLAGLLTTN